MILSQRDYKEAFFLRFYPFSFSLLATYVFSSNLGSVEQAVRATLCFVVADQEMFQLSQRFIEKPLLLFLEEITKEKMQLQILNTMKQNAKLDKVKVEQANEEIEERKRL